jgi:hypothetical protein
MNIMSARKSVEEKAVAATNIEGELEGLVRRELGGQRRAVSEPSTNVSDKPNGQPESGADMITRQVNTLIQRVSVTSVKEIDKLISELQGLRNFLDNESQRVQREIASYAHLSDTALKSTHIIAESLAQWKRDAS